jgi:hypothetical protein
VKDKRIVRVEVPLTFTFLAGIGEPPPKARKAIAKANMVDWQTSHVDFSPLTPWAGHPDDRYPRQLFKRLTKRFPELHMEVIQIQVRGVSQQKKWGELVTIEEF